MSAFKRAQRKSAKLRAAICGTAGSGKTYSALLLAAGLGDTIAVIDTERGSSELYSDIVGFDVTHLLPPFDPKRYIALIKDAAQHYDVLIIDSLSHAWAGEGGILEIHDNATRADRGGNSYTAWRNVTPQHNALVDAILNAPCHVIVTMRSKTAYELVENEKGKKTPIKIGLAPIQRDGMEYEFTIVWDVSVNGNVASASKDRTRLWNGRNAVITEKHGNELKEWLESGAPAESPKSATEPTELHTANPYDHAAASRLLLSCLTPEAVREWVSLERKDVRWQKDHPDYLKLIEIAKARITEIESHEAPSHERQPLNPAPGKKATPASLSAAGYSDGDPAPFNDSLEGVV